MTAASIRISPAKAAERKKRIEPFYFLLSI
jgi:hypothetical protein